MKLDIINTLTEDQQMARIMSIMEDLFDGRELEDLSGDDENLLGGIRKLEELAANSGDEMSFEDIELASAAFQKLAVLLKSSRDALQEQLQINRLTGKKKPSY